MGRDFGYEICVNTDECECVIHKDEYKEDVCNCEKSSESAAGNNQIFLRNNQYPWEILNACDRSVHVTYDELEGYINAFFEKYSKITIAQMMINTFNYLDSDNWDEWEFYICLCDVLQVMKTKHSKCVWFWNC